MEGVTKQFSNSSVDTSWVSYNLIPFWHYRCEESIRSHRPWAQSHKTVPTSKACVKSSSSPGLLTHSWKNRGSHDPLLRFHHLASVTHRTQRNGLLTSFQVYYEGHNSGRARWQVCWGQGTSMEACVLFGGAALPASLFGFIFLVFHGGFIYYGVMVHDTIGGR